MSDTRVIIETPNGLRKLELDGYLREDRNMWRAIGAYDAMNGTNFYHFIDIRNFVVVDFFNRYVGIPDLTMDDFQGGDGMTELKPCPFCGGEKISFWWGRDDLNSEWYNGTLKCNACGARIVRSMNLSAVNTSDAKKYRLGEGCCKAWNRRVKE